MIKPNNGLYNDTHKQSRLFDLIFIHVEDHHN